MAGVKLARALSALAQLGPRQVGWYVLYQAGLRLGLWRRLTPPGRSLPLAELRGLLSVPRGGRAGLAGVLDIPARVHLLAEAEEICAGQLRLFGGPPVPLSLISPGQVTHWSAYERGLAPWGGEDVKYLWEPARFGWAFTLGRAYLLSGDEDFSTAFWGGFETFDSANPPNLGPNWTSGQEVALRGLALAFAAGVFAGSPASTPARLARLSASVAEHAARILPTLSYARAQHNNHHISEALGLYAAGLCLPAHPQSSRWRELGWRELNTALQAQIAADGTYAQHSVSYHRLMLQAALLADNLARAEGRAWPAQSTACLIAAVGWLEERTDRRSGRASNLGSNDGALILPLSPGEIDDYRPVLQAASLAFRAHPVFPPGTWDELGLWLGLPVPAAAPVPEPPHFAARLEHSRLPDTWAGLRVASFTSRPAHADLLHVDLWHGGENLALDAGTYRYSAPPPWENALAATCVHNTLSVDGLDQMTRAGKFLWLDWAAAHLLESEPGSLRAEQDGYCRLGILHRRTLQEQRRGWLVHDELLPLASTPGLSAEAHTFLLHWLLPDWPYSLDGRTLTLVRPGEVPLRLRLRLVASESDGAVARLRIARAGESLYGAPAPLPILGWRSPTYGLRLPALSVQLSLRAPAPVSFQSYFDIG